MLSIMGRRGRDDRELVEVSNLYAEGHVLQKIPIRRKDMLQTMLVMQHVPR